MRRIFTLVFALIFISCPLFCLGANAAQEDTKAWEILRMNRTDKEIPQNSFILNFDVSDDGRTAVALANRNIAVYKDGEFLYAFNFLGAGLYYVYWQNENLCLYLTREKQLFEFDMSGKLLSMNTEITEAQAQTIIKFSDRTNISENGCVYSLENDLGIFNKMILRDEYVKLKKNDTVIYDCRIAAIVKVIERILLWVVFIGGGVYLAIRFVKANVEEE